MLDCISLSTLRPASFSAAITRSCSISTSPAFTASGSILMASTCLRPSIFTVTVKMDGRKQVLAIKIDPEAVKAGDVEMLQDLVMAALNEAGRKVDKEMQSSMGGMLGGLGLGGL